MIVFGKNRLILVFTIQNGTERVFYVSASRESISDWYGKQY